MHDWKESCQIAGRMYNDIIYAHLFAYNSIQILLKSKANANIRDCNLKQLFITIITFSYK